MSGGRGDLFTDAVALVHAVPVLPAIPRQTYQKTRPGTERIPGAASALDGIIEGEASEITMIDTESRRNLRAQWAFCTRNVLGRFHLWLEDVEETWVKGGPVEDLSFVGSSLEKALIVTAAVTALGTRLFGRYGEGKGLSKTEANRVKKDADAASAYAMSESLWYLTRNLPENHAIMVSLGEGLMPKGGETPDMGSNPLLGFGRIYARPQVARWLEQRIHRLINDPGYRFNDFWMERARAGVTVWGAAIDTLENTSRFARGDPYGPMTVLHLYDQPLRVSRPYEGYVGNLVLPKAVVEKAQESSLLLDYLTPRPLVMKTLQLTYPGLKAGNVHVWTLGGENRAGRIGTLWNEWRSVGAHLVEEGWMLPAGYPVFTESGTYAPTYAIGPFTRDGETHLFIADGYAATAEALQASSLDPIVGNTTSMCLFTSKFDVSWENERQIIQLDPTAGDFALELSKRLGHEATPKEVDVYRGVIFDAQRAEMPLGKRTLTADDFFPRKEWDGLALTGYMLPDPYSGVEGVKHMDNGLYEVRARAASRKGILEARLVLRLMEPFESSKLIFSPLLDRFYRRQDFRTRPVKVSDSGRIRNELQTLCSEALTYTHDGKMTIHFDRIEDSVLSPDKRQLIHEVLTWYKQHHPIWFLWLDIA